MSNRKISDTTKALIEAKGLIEDPEIWIGETPPVGGSRHCAFSVLSVPLGIKNDHEFFTKTQGGPFEFLNEAAYELFNRCAIHVNDSLGHAATLEMYDRAIALSMQADAEQGR